MAERERYLPTADQQALAEAMGDPLADLLPIGRLHQAGHESDETWQALTELGLFGMTRPEDQGGAGLGPVEEALVAFELGRRLASPAVIATLIGAPHVDLEPGEAIAAAWSDDDGRVVMVDEPRTRRVLVRNAAGISRIGQANRGGVIDEVHWAVRLIEVAVPTAEPLALDELDEARVRLLQGAVLAGLATTALDMAVAYAGFRQQFGRPIGSFQAVKHHCANMALAARGARDLVTFAAVALAEGDAGGVILAESALLTAMMAAERNAALNVQIHGGVGFSDEADPHLLVKRARLYISVAGGVDAALERNAVTGVAA